MTPKAEEMVARTDAFLMPGGRILRRAPGDARGPEVQRTADGRRGRPAQQLPISLPRTVDEGIHREGRSRGRGSRRMCGMAGDVAQGKMRKWA